MFNQARKLPRLLGFAVTRIATASPFRILGEQFLDASTGALSECDVREKCDRSFEVQRLVGSLPLRANRAKSLACVGLIHQPLIHLHDGRYVGKRLAERRDMAAVAFHRVFAGIVGGEREFQVAVEASQQIAQIMSRSSADITVKS